MHNPDTKHAATGIGAMLLVAAAWGWALTQTPTDQHMGDVYRIIYLHVPAAISSFVVAYILLGASLVSLKRRSPRALHVARASAEVGLLLTVITLITGSIWGYPTWGVWWTWDARITTTFLLALMNAGYILLYNAVSDTERRMRVCGILAVLIALDIPIIYKSVTWWRTLHQPPSLMRAGGSTMDPDMRQALLAALAALLIFVVWLIIHRAGNISLKSQVDDQSLAQL